MASPGGSARGTHPTVQTRYLVGSVVLIAVSFVAIGIAAAAVALGQKLPEIVLTLLLLFGVVVLLGSIGALLVLLAGFGIIDPKEALGLPSGSVRAIIALTLILIFAIVSVFLFWNRATTPTYRPASRRSRSGCCRAARSSRSSRTPGQARRPRPTQSRPRTPSSPTSWRSSS